MAYVANWIKEFVLLNVGLRDETASALTNENGEKKKLWSSKTSLPKSKNGQTRSTDLSEKLFVPKNNNFGFHVFDYEQL